MIIFEIISPDLYVRDEKGDEKRNEKRR